jgi:pantoate--beta-alanine ligase
VVTKLFGIIQPDAAFFGQKDAQQLRVVTQLVADLNLPLRIVGVPTVRDGDGVALSSRNALLSGEERVAARCVIGALLAAAHAWAAGERNPQHLRDLMAAYVEQEPRATLDYASIADADSLLERNTLMNGDEAALASIAVQIGSVRLIDNLVLREGEDPLQAVL